MSYFTGTVLATKDQFVNVIPPKDYTGAASTDVYVSLKNAAHATIIITTGAWAAGTSAITLLQATAVAGTSTKALSFTKMWTNAADLTSTALVETAVVSDTFTIGAAATLWIIEVDASSLDVANNFDCLAVHGATPGSNADLYSAVMILSGLRYGGKTPPNALVD